MKYGYIVHLHPVVVSVGYYTKMGSWVAVEFFDTVEDALVLVRKLNKK